MHQSSPFINSPQQQLGADTRETEQPHGKKKEDIFLPDIRSKSSRRQSHRRSVSSSNIDEERAEGNTYQRLSSHYPQQAGAYDEKSKEQHFLSIQPGSSFLAGELNLLAMSNKGRKVAEQTSPLHVGQSLTSPVSPVRDKSVLLSSKHSIGRVVTSSQLGNNEVLARSPSPTIHSVGLPQRAAPQYVINVSPTKKPSPLFVRTYVTSVASVTAAVSQQSNKLLDHPLTLSPEAGEHRVVLEKNLSLAAKAERLNAPNSSGKEHLLGAPTFPPREVSTAALASEYIKDLHTGNVVERSKQRWASRGQRPLDVAVMDQHKRREAVVIIQCCWRSHVARTLARRLKQKRDRKVRALAIAAIQRNYRKHRALRICIRHSIATGIVPLWAPRVILTAVLRVQGWWRWRSALERIVRRIRTAISRRLMRKILPRAVDFCAEKILAFRHVEARKIQMCFRRYNMKQRALELGRKRRRQLAATATQTIYRMHVAVKKLKHRRCMRAALTLQCCFRQYIARAIRRTRTRRKASSRFVSVLLAKAVITQARDICEKCAIDIQRVFRGQRVRVSVNYRKLMMEEKKRRSSLHRPSYSHAIGNVRQAALYYQMALRAGYQGSASFWKMFARCHKDCWEASGENYSLQMACSAYRQALEYPENAIDEVLFGEAIYLHLRHNTPKETAKLITRYLKQFSASANRVALSFELAVQKREAGQYDGAIKGFQELRSNPPPPLSSSDVGIVIASTYEKWASTEDKSRMEKANTLYKAIFLERELSPGVGPFYGYLSESAASEMLNEKPPGSFIVYRTKEKDPSRFAVQIVQEPPPKPSEATSQQSVGQQALVVVLSSTQTPPATKKTRIVEFNRKNNKFEYKRTRVTAETLAELLRRLPLAFGLDLRRAVLVDQQSFYLSWQEWVASAHTWKNLAVKAEAQGSLALARDFYQQTVLLTPPPSSANASAGMSGVGTTTADKLQQAISSYADLWFKVALYQHDTGFNLEAIISIQKSIKAASSAPVFILDTPLDELANNSLTRRQSELRAQFIGRRKSSLSFAPHSNRTSFYTAMRKEWSRPYSQFERDLFDLEKSETLITRAYKALNPPQQQARNKHQVEPRKAALILETIWKSETYFPDIRFWDALGETHLDTWYASGEQYNLQRAGQALEGLKQYPTEQVSDWMVFKLALVYFHKTEFSSCISALEHHFFPRFPRSHFYRYSLLLHMIAACEAFDHEKSMNSGTKLLQSLDLFHIPSISDQSNGDGIGLPYPHYVFFMLYARCLERWGLYLRDKAEKEKEMIKTRGHAEERAREVMEEIGMAIEEWDQRKRALEEAEVISFHPNAASLVENPVEPLREQDAVSKLQDQSHEVLRSPARTIEATIPVSPLAELAEDVTSAARGKDESSATSSALNPTGEPPTMVEPQPPTATVDTASPKSLIAPPRIPPPKPPTGRPAAPKLKKLKKGKSSSGDSSPKKGGKQSKGQSTAERGEEAEKGFFEDVIPSAEEKVGKGAKKSKKKKKKKGTDGGAKQKKKRTESPQEEPEMKPVDDDGYERGASSTAETSAEGEDQKPRKPSILLSNTHLRRVSRAYEDKKAELGPRPVMPNLGSLIPPNLQVPVDPDATTAEANVKLNMAAKAYRNAFLVFYRDAMMKEVVRVAEEESKRVRERSSRVHVRVIRASCLHVPSHRISIDPFVSVHCRRKREEDVEDKSQDLEDTEAWRSKKSKRFSALKAKSKAHLEKEKEWERARGAAVTTAVKFRSLAPHWDELLDVPTTLPGEFSLNTSANADKDKEIVIEIKDRRRFKSDGKGEIGDLCIGSVTFPLDNFRDGKKHRQCYPLTYHKLSSEAFVGSIEVEIQWLEEFSLAFSQRTKPHGMLEASRKGADEQQASLASTPGSTTVVKPSFSSGISKSVGSSQPFSQTDAFASTDGSTFPASSTEHSFTTASTISSENLLVITRERVRAALLALSQSDERLREWMSDVSMWASLIRLCIAQKHFSIAIDLCHASVLYAKGGEEVEILLLLARTYKASYMDAEAHQTVERALTLCFERRLNNKEVIALKYEWEKEITTYEQELQTHPYCTPWVRFKDPLTDHYHFYNIETQSLTSTVPAQFEHEDNYRDVEMIAQARAMEGMKALKPGVRERVEAARRSAEMGHSSDPMKWVEEYDEAEDRFRFRSKVTGQVTDQQPPTYVMTGDFAKILATCSIQMAYRQRVARRKAVQRAKKSGHANASLLAAHMAEGERGEALKKQREEEERQRLQSLCVLLVTLSHAEGLSPSRQNGINPYVELSVNGNTWKTRVADNVNPVYSELFGFEARWVTEQKLSLQISVLDFDFENTHFLGKTAISIMQLDHGRPIKGLCCVLRNERGVETPSLGKIYLDLHWSDKASLPSETIWLLMREEERRKEEDEWMILPPEGALPIPELVYPPYIPPPKPDLSDLNLRQIETIFIMSNNSIAQILHVSDIVMQLNRLGLSMQEALDKQKEQRRKGRPVSVALEEEANRCDVRITNVVRLKLAPEQKKVEKQLVLVRRAIGIFERTVTPVLHQYYATIKQKEAEYEDIKKATREEHQRLVDKIVEENEFRVKPRRVKRPYKIERSKGIIDVLNLGDPSSKQHEGSDEEDDESSPQDTAEGDSEGDTGNDHNKTMSNGAPPLIPLPSIPSDQFKGEAGSGDKRSDGEGASQSLSAGISREGEPDDDLDKSEGRSKASREEEKVKNETKGLEEADKVLPSNDQTRADGKEHVIDKPVPQAPLEAKKKGKKRFRFRLFGYRENKKKKQQQGGARRLANGKKKIEKKRSWFRKLLPWGDDSEGEAEEDDAPMVEGESKEGNGAVKDKATVEGGQSGGLASTSEGTLLSSRPADAAAQGPSIFDASDAVQSKVRMKWKMIQKAVRAAHATGGKKKKRKPAEEGGVMIETELGLVQVVGAESQMVLVEVKQQELKDYKRLLINTLAKVHEVLAIYESHEKAQKLIESFQEKLVKAIPDDMLGMYRPAKALLTEKGEEEKTGGAAGATDRKVKTKKFPRRKLPGEGLSTDEEKEDEDKTQNRKKAKFTRTIRGAAVLVRDTRRRGGPRIENGGVASSNILQLGGETNVEKSIPKVEEANIPEVKAQERAAGDPSAGSEARTAEHSEEKPAVASQPKKPELVSPESEEKVEVLAKSVAQTDKTPKASAPSVSPARRIARPETEEGKALPKRQKPARRKPPPRG